MNVIVLINDTWRWDYLGCAGANFIHTPNLDRLATKGTVLNQNVLHLAGLYASTYNTDNRPICNEYWLLR